MKKFFKRIFNIESIESTRCMEEPEETMEELDVVIQEEPKLDNTIEMQYYLHYAEFFKKRMENFSIEPTENAEFFMNEMEKFFHYYSIQKASVEAEKLSIPFEENMNLSSALIPSIGVEVEHNHVNPLCFSLKLTKNDITYWIQKRNDGHTWFRILINVNDSHFKRIQLFCNELNHEKNPIIWNDFVTDEIKDRVYDEFSYFIGFNQDNENILSDFFYQKNYASKIKEDEINKEKISILNKKLNII